MFSSSFGFTAADMGGYPPTFRQGRTPVHRPFDEYYRCYPVVMLPGPERPELNYGGKVIMPPSALDMITRLHMDYPLMFELINGAQDKLSHAGVLEFIAEEGKIFLPAWLMQVLQLEAGDLIQVKSTKLDDGRFIKLQAQSTSFLDISDPKAVLEREFRNFSCLTKGDVFTFRYNDKTYDMAVLETKPVSDKGGISVLETDLEVDFATPIGYEEPKAVPKSGQASKATGTSGGVIHSSGTMAKAINYAAIAPGSQVAAQGAQNAASHFSSEGRRLNPKKARASAGTATPVPLTEPQIKVPAKRTNGPQPLRLPPEKLFFGYEIKPVKKKDGTAPEDEKKPKFAGQGQSLRASKKDEPASL